MIFSICELMLAMSKGIPPGDQAWPYIENVLMHFKLTADIFTFHSDSQNRFANSNKKPNEN